MFDSKCLTLPLVVLLTSATLTSAPANGSMSTSLPIIARIESDYQTTSINKIAQEYSIEDLRVEALQLFGYQSNFTADEQATYRLALANASENVGINIFDLF